MPAPANLVHETSTSTGTGNLSTAAVNGRQRFSVFGTGSVTNVFDYFISNQAAAEWERGTGHMSATSTLVRDTVIESSNSNALVSFSAGTKDIMNDVPAAEQMRSAVNLAPGAGGVASIDQAVMNLKVINRVSVSDANYTALTTDRYIEYFTALTANRTLTMPAVGTVSDGQRFEVFAWAPSGFSLNIVIAGGAVFLLPGGTSPTTISLTGAGTSVILVKSGGGYFVLGGSAKFAGGAGAVALGSAAYENTGSSGHAVPFLDASTNTFSGSIAVTGNIATASTFFGHGLSLDNAGQVSEAFHVSDGGTDQKWTDVIYSSGGITFRLINDAYSAASNWLTVGRTGYATGDITFGGRVVAPVSLGFFTQGNNSGLDLGFGTMVRRMSSDGRLELSSQSGVTHTTGNYSADGIVQANGASIANYINALSWLYSGPTGSGTYPAPGNFNGGSAVGWNFSGGNAEVTYWNTYGGFVPTISFEWRQQTAAGASNKIATLGTAGLVLNQGTVIRGVPITKSADFTLGPNENFIVNTKTSAHCLVTLPAASSCPGREVFFLNHIDWRIKSASANVVPKGGGALQDTICLPTFGTYSSIISDGTNWIIFAWSDLSVTGGQLYGGFNMNPLPGTPSGGSAGTITNGQTWQPDALVSNYQSMTNNSTAGQNVTIAAPIFPCAIDISWVNGTVTTGSVTFSGFNDTGNHGDPITTVANAMFIVSIRKTNVIYSYFVKACQ